MKKMKWMSLWRPVFGNREEKKQYRWTATQFDLLEVAYCIWSQKSLVCNQGAKPTYHDVCHLLCDLFGMKTPKNLTSKMDKIRNRAHIKQNSYLLNGFREAFPYIKL